MLALLLLFAVLPGPQSAADLSPVLERAKEYVARYEAELGNLIGSEEYVQNAAWLTAGPVARIGKREQRRTSSDFLIIQIGPEWVALRKVNRVGGLPVKDPDPDFQNAFDDSPEANAQRVRDMKADSTRYNIGDIRREINLPTFALKILRKAEVDRFAFERAGSSRIAGVQTWGVRFREVSSPTLVVGGNGEDLYSTGTFWIEPETGRVLKTEFSVENPFVESHIRASSIVTYEQGKTVGMLVPNLMVEHYESQYNTIDGRADYSNFRPFEVDVKFEISSPILSP